MLAAEEADRRFIALQQEKAMKLAETSAEYQVGAAAIQSVGDAISSGFGAMLDGLFGATVDMAQVLKGMLKGILMAVVNTFIQMGIQQMLASLLGSVAAKTLAVSKITAEAAAGGAAAAASTAAIPIVGPALAIPAGVGMTSAINATFLPMVASAAKGWDLPAGGPFPAVLHSREMVLPENQADVIRNISKFNATPGGNTFIINAVDAKSVERALTKDDVLINVMRSYQRSGRL